MTVAELIEALQAIEDQQQQVVVEGYISCPQCECECDQDADIQEVEPARFYVRLRV